MYHDIVTMIKLFFLWHVDDKDENSQGRGTRDEGQGTGDKGAANSNEEWRMKNEEWKMKKSPFITNTNLNLKMDFVKYELNSYMI